MIIVVGASSSKMLSGLYGMKTITDLALPHENE
jgi:hypothetical protein